MSDINKQYKIERFDFGFSPRSNSLSQSFDNQSFSQNNKKGGKIASALMKAPVIGNGIKTLLRILFIQFSRAKWKISRSIFLGRGIYFKYISHLSILIIVVFGTFAYMSYYTASADKDAFFSKYTKASMSNESILYTAGGKAVLPQKQFSIIKYKVAAGDTLSSIAQKMSTKDNEISIDSILWANNLQSNAILQPGTVLDIPPVSGILHTVAKGESATDVAKKYRKINDKSTPEEVFAVMQELTDINILDIKVEGDKKVPVLVEGQKIIVPGGVKVTEAKVAQVQQPIVKAPVTNVRPQPQNISLGFIWPVAGGAGTVTRGLLSYHTGVDIADFNSPMLVASASGTIISTQWEGGGGGCVVRIKYDNGYLGLYAHSRCNYRVRPGQWVPQGALLVQMGSTGNSTGIHLHYELYSPQGALLNPLAFIRR